ncbi:MAG: hypothetical protein IKN15_02995 [Bacteroidaceae bacterium]|nr:hypothetical protein [Prevotella sp.]MBR6892202.1 hypothetical protein [Bacteroidaceae bacterium]
MIPLLYQLSYTAVKMTLLEYHIRSFIAGTSSCATSNFSSCNTLQPQVRKDLASFNLSLALLREER